MTAPVLSVDGLSKHFGGVQAVRDVGFDVEAGEIVALIGPNGAGKSTCFNMLGGQIRPDSGRVRVGGRDVTGRSPPRIFRAGVGRTFQIARVFASMTVLENVQTALLSHRRRHYGLLVRARGQHAALAERLLGRVGMAGQAHRPAEALAYGDIKRVELAMALANDPALILMDEPTAGMAPGERATLMRQVTELARRDGRAVLFTEHDMDVVFGHADRVLVMDRGALIAEGTPATVRRDPEVRRVYLGTLGTARAGQARDDAAEPAAC
jgi:branched-chain amino acid transport system ATP-binding protein